MSKRKLTREEVIRDITAKFSVTPDMPRHEQAARWYCAKAGVEYISSRELEDGTVWIDARWGKVLEGICITGTVDV